MDTSPYTRPGDWPRPSRRQLAFPRPGSMIVPQAGPFSRSFAHDPTSTNCQLVATGNWLFVQELMPALNKAVCGK
jgi:hypothetical protein